MKIDPMMTHDRSPDYEMSTARRLGTHAAKLRWVSSMDMEMRNPKRNRSVVQHSRKRAVSMTSTDFDNLPEKCPIL